jgi:membrane-bound inhibitor of C-type lysozyme
VSQSRLFLALAATATLAACTDPQDRPENIQSPLIRPPMLETRPASFDCDDSGRVIVRPLGEDGKAVTLDAAEGLKYSDGATVFWMNGDAANLLVAGKSAPESCEKP